MIRENFKIISLIVILYFSLILGFFLNENLNFGSYIDWEAANKILINDYSKNFFETFLSHNEYTRHSPVYYIFLSLFLKLNFSIEFIRLFHLHLSLILIFVFFKCLETKFEEVPKNFLIFLSLIIFLSPTFRSLSIWPDSRLPGLLFFTVTIYFFLKFEKEKSEKFIWLTSSSLIIASYISPNFSIFFIYFFYNFLKNMKLTKIFIFIFCNCLASLPILYYLFVMDVNFLTYVKTPEINGDGIAMSLNLSNKFMIISTIILFHLLPVLISKNHFFQFIIFFKKYFIYLLIFTLFLIYFFDYKTSFTGGGVFFNLSDFLLKNNYFFYAISLISISFLAYLSKLNINNFYIFLILILSNIQNTIYHKYYEPFVLIIFLTILKNVDVESFIKNKKNIFNFYILSFIYILMRIYKNLYLA
tara:strand:- start:47 stop:1294 length:1248 start_codon:yes stop_codon:yes gene_type:complete